MKTIRWGIIGCGKIANAFAEGLKAVDGAELSACASRTPGRAAQFAEKFAVSSCYESYEALVADPAVDVVYVATTHNFHFENSMLCLEAGKPVLCEKAFTVNAMQAERLIAAAREKRLFLMEAMWTRFLPAVVRLRELLAEGAIGEVRGLLADFSIWANQDPAGRWFNPELAGGALLDLGVYPVSFASMIFGGAPAKMISSARLGETGIDESGEYIFEYPDGQRAMLRSSLMFHAPIQAVVSGTEGWIRLLPPFHRPDTIEIGRRGKDAERISLPVESTGYNYEAEEVGRCLRAGLSESPVMPLEETLEIMRTMDALRAGWGLRYPGE